jgi:hypothetical protein
MSIRWAFFIVFLGLLGLLSWSRSKKRLESEYQAARTLTINTRVNSDLWTLRRGDDPASLWRAPKTEDLAGKYVKNTINEGEAITPTKLSVFPQVIFPKDTVPFTLPLRDLGPVGMYVNAGTKVYICDQETMSCPGSPYEVKALIGKVESQLILFCLPVKEADEVRKIKNPTLHLAALP